MPTQDNLRFVAEKLGYIKAPESEAMVQQWIAPCALYPCFLPDWEHSVDALLAEGGPVEWVLDEDGDYEITGWYVKIYIVSKVYTVEYESLADLASALFEACYKAMGGTDDSEN